MKLLLISEQGKKYITDKKELQTDKGKVDLSKAKPGQTVESHLGHKYIVLEPKFPDLLDKAKRGPQAIILKDAGIIAAYTGLEPGNKVVDAGLGSGWLTAFLARIIKPGKVISFERNSEFVTLAKKNLDWLNIKNVTIKEKDFSECKEKNADLVTLDLLNPENYLDVVSKSLKNSGFLVCYVPHVSQLMSLESEIHKREDFMFEKVVEVIEREWNIKDRISRPKNQMLGHTAFLAFIRKIS